MSNENFYDVVVIGGGPAGLTAALYLARACYRVLVIEKEKFGGQITITDEVVNYPGVMKTSGKELTQAMQKQAEHFGAEFLLGDVVSLKKAEEASGAEIWETTTDKGSYKSFGILLATGAHPRMIGFPGEAKFRGHGVAYCATCDGEFFRFVCREQESIKALDMKLIAAMVRRCCEIKAGVVERDPKEQGERALLNLGHTVGHAVEKLKNFTLLHGQCVGVGLVAAAYLSMKRGLLTKEEYQEICQGCSDYDLPVHVDGLIPEEVLSATKKDKKMEQGHIRFILMDGIGKSFIDKTVTDEELLSCIQEITL